MRNYITLTKILLKNIGSASITKKASGKQSSQLLLMVVVGLAMLPLFFSIYAMAAGLYEVMQEIGQQGLVLLMGLSLSTMTIFFFGIFYVLNVFYFSKDIDSLLPLPLRPAEILGAKFTVTVIFEYLTELIVLLPILLAYGIKSGSGPIYYLYALVIFITLPVIPLVYASALNMIIMRFTSLGKNKDKFRIIGGIIGMFFALGFNFYLQRITSSRMSSRDIQQLLMQGDNSLINVMNGIFPANKAAAWGMVNTLTLKGLLYLLIFLGITAVFAALFLMLGELLYFKGVIGMSEASSKKRKITKEEYAKLSVQNSFLRACLAKELRLLIRTPIYFINCVLMNFLWPVFLMLPILSQGDASVGIDQLRVFAMDSQNAALILAIGLGLSVFVSSSNNIASTSISREGTDVYVSKFLPVSYITQILAKVLSGVLIGGAGMLVILIFAFIVFQLPLYLMLIMGIISFLAISFTCQLGVMIDLDNPKLVWDNEQKAVKQNFNAFTVVIISAAVTGLIVILPLTLRLGVWSVFALFLAAYLILNGGFYYVLTTRGVRKFEKIEI